MNFQWQEVRNAIKEVELSCYSFLDFKLRQHSKSKEVDFNVYYLKIC